MTEPASTVASYSRIIELESLPLPPELVIGIDIGTSPFCVCVWDDSEAVVWQNNINDVMKRCCETSKDHDFSIGASSSSSSSSGSEVSLSLENQDIISDMYLFFNIIFGERANLPFMMHTLDIKVRPFVDAFMNKLWRTTTAIELLAKFLMELRSLVEAQLNRHIKNVVFSVPVSFSELQKNRIHCACEMVDLKVIGLLPLPTAVTWCYAVQQLHATPSHEVMENEHKKIALIFNMDAGYCDVSVSEVERGKFHIKALIGSTIGREDLLGNMMCYLLPDSEKIFKRNFHWNSDIISMAYFRSRINDVITELSSQTSVEVNLKSVDGLKIQRVVTREEFEEVNKEVFEKCKRLIIQCLQDAKIEVENINDVIIVGECCNIPMVKNLVTKICNGKEIFEGMNPLVAALCGSAMAGAVYLS
jgi:heat shock protein 4